MKIRKLLTMSVVAFVTIFILASHAPAVSVNNEFNGQVTRMSTQMTRALGGIPDVQFAFDMDRGSGSKPTISNLWFDVNDDSYQQSGRMKVKMKDSAMKDRLIITGRLSGDQSGKARPMSFKIVFEDWTGTAFGSDDFLAGILDPDDFSRAVWSINMGKGKKLTGNIESPLMALAFSSQNAFYVDDGQPGGYDNGYPPNGETPNGGGTPVPEPATLLLIGTGLLGLALKNRHSGN